MERNFPLYWEVKEGQKIILSAETHQHQCYLIISMALELFWTVQMSSHQFQCQQNNQVYLPFTCTGISETPSIIVKVQQIKLVFFSFLCVEKILVLLDKS